MWLLGIDHYLDSFWNPKPTQGWVVCPYKTCHGFELNSKIRLPNFCNPFLYIVFTYLNEFVIGRTMLDNL